MNSSSPPTAPLFGKELLADDLLKHFLGAGAGRFCDVQLVCNDGGCFQTNRGLLGARSDYFASLLFSGFKEQQEDVVDIDLSSKSLTAVLQYILSGSFEHNKDATIDSAQEVIKIRNVADYIDCSGMYELCSLILVGMLEHNNVLACLLIDTSMDRKKNGDVLLFNTALEIVKENPDVIIGSTFVDPNVENECQYVKWLSKQGLKVLFEAEHLHPKPASTLKCVPSLFKHTKILDVTWFKIVQAWFNYHRSKSDPPLHCNEMFDFTGQLDYENLPLQFLCDVVEPSGLMGTTHISSAFKHHALRYKEERDETVEQLEQRDEEYEEKDEELTDIADKNLKLQERYEHLEATHKQKLRKIRDALKTRHMYQSVKHLF